MLSHAVSKFTIGTEGNVSKKINDTFLIKSSGTSLGTLTQDEIILCDKDGTQLNNFNHKPSIETGFHSWALKFPSINFVAHTHPTNTLKILCSQFIYEFANCRLFPDQVVFNWKRSCIVPYAHPGYELMNAIKLSVDEFLSNETNIFPKLILLQNHGIICVGTSYKECVIASEICEKSAEIFMGAIRTKRINYLSKSDIDKILDDKNEIYRARLLSITSL